MIGINGVTRAAHQAQALVHCISAYWQPTAIVVLGAIVARSQWAPHGRPNTVPPQVHSQRLPLAAVGLSDKPVEPLKRPTLVVPPSPAPVTPAPATRALPAPVVIATSPDDWPEPDRTPDIPIAHAILRTQVNHRDPPPKPAPDDDESERVSLPAGVWFTPRRFHGKTDRGVEYSNPSLIALLKDLDVLNAYDQAMATWRASTAQQAPRVVTYQAQQPSFTQYGTSSFLPAPSSSYGMPYVLGGGAGFR
jgi:hypothetical protein